MFLLSHSLKVCETLHSTSESTKCKVNFAGIDFQKQLTRISSVAADGRYRLGDQDGWFSAIKPGFESPYRYKNSPQRHKEHVNSYLRDMGM